MVGCNWATGLATTVAHGAGAASLSTFLVHSLFIQLRWIGMHQAFIQKPWGFCWRHCSHVHLFWAGVMVMVNWNRRQSLVMKHESDWSTHPAEQWISETTSFYIPTDDVGCAYGWWLGGWLGNPLTFSTLCSCRQRAMSFQSVNYTGVTLHITGIVLHYRYHLPLTHFQQFLVQLLPHWTLSDLLARPGIRDVGQHLTVQLCLSYQPGYPSV